MIASILLFHKSVFEIQFVTLLRDKCYFVSLFSVNILFRKNIFIYLQNYKNETIKKIMNAGITNNYSKLKLSLFFLPLALLLLITAFLYSHNSLNVENYTQIQKNWFLFINSKLSQYPNVIYNLTQFGDAAIFLSFLGVFIVYAPKLWEALLSSLLLSGIICCSLKKLFSVPRPAIMYDETSFAIIGRKLCGINSLPSGHSITVFSILTVLLFAFMPKKLVSRTVWISFIILTGGILVLTRVGVGAHYPLDTLIGSIIGFICGILGIFICRKYKIWNWIGNRKYYPIFILWFLICLICLIHKIINENLIIFYFSFFSLVLSLYKIITVYVQK